MEEGIYVRLPEEGTRAYRFVPTLPIGDGDYQHQDHNLYDLDVEVWEFTPNTLVKAELKDLMASPVLIAIEKLPTED